MADKSKSIMDSIAGLFNREEEKKADLTYKPKVKEYNPQPEDNLSKKAKRKLNVEDPKALF